MTGSQSADQEFTERHLKFVFDNSWSVEKYDAHADYDRIERSVVGTKGVDFVACRTTPERVVYFIEVKDFRGYPVNQRQELRSEDLAAEIAQKVRDTLAGLVGGCRQLSSRAIWQPYLKGICDPETQFKIILWLEPDFRAPSRRSNSETIFALKLKGKLRWLTKNVLVVNSREVGDSLPGLTVTSLARGDQSPAD